MPLPIASVDRLIRKAGAQRVSEGAAKELASFLEEVGVVIANMATHNANEMERKTVKAEDIEVAIQVYLPHTLKEILPKDNKLGT